MSYKALFLGNVLIALAFFGVATASAQALTVSGVGVTNIAQTSADINWTTGTSSDSRVFYGTSTAYGLSSVLQTATTTAHAVSLAGLTASTTYHFMAQSKDDQGNIATSSDYAFTTLAADTAAPAISGIIVSGITQTAANINWTTNEPADTQVEYGTSISYGLSSALQSATTTAHAVALGSLTASTTYHFIAKSRDAAGNLATSTDATFTTLASVVIPPPATTTADVLVGVKVEPKTINGKSKGKWIEVRVTFPEGYDARDADMTSIKLNGTLSPERVKVKAKKNNGHDDDDEDEQDRESRLHLKFSRSAVIALLSGGTTATSTTATSTDPSFVQKQIVISGTVGTKTFGGSTTVRFRSATDLPEGTVFRSADGSEVYIIVNGKKRHIPSLKAFEALGLTWSRVLVVSQAVADAAEGDVLIKSVNSPAVYLISGGKKRHVKDPSEFEGQGLDWSDITAVSGSELAFYPTVSAVTLLRVSGDAKVYFISSGQRHWVPSEAAFNKRGFKWDDIVIVDESERDKYKEGARAD